uniref:Uncharacterized protein n=1 Tax=Cucumis melo TaxID=3656 RepID=A0A9I9DAM1_CUCME
ELISLSSILSFHTERYRNPKPKSLSLSFTSMAAHQLPLEEAMPWLPSQVLDEACDIKVYMRQRHHYHHIQQPPFLHRQRPHHRPLLSPSDFALSLNEKSKYSNICSRPNQKQKPASNWTAGGQGMQAIFSRFRPPIRRYRRFSSSRNRRLQ